MVSKAVLAAIILAPLILATEMVANCWVHGKTREACDPDGQVPEMVSQAVATVFAWLANPPH
jgi:hypothetical protein